MNKNIIRTSFLALGAIFALLLIIVGIGGYFITSPAPIDEWGTTWVEPTDEAATRLDDKIAALEQEIDDATAGAELTLEITEEEATSKLDKLSRAGELALEMDDTQIYLSDGMVQAFAKVDMVIGVQVALQAKIEVEDGKPDITIEHLHLGRIPIPKTLINTVMTALERGLEEYWDDLPVVFKYITIEHGAMTITMVKKD